MMSPASKSKDKKVGKESQKAPSKPSGPANAGGGVPASAYNPLLGTFHTIETVPLSSASPLQNNGRFKNIDETDEHLRGSFVSGVEYDSISNNDSLSGESEDHKEKSSNPPVKQEIIPGADHDKRERNRQKNERKHQRQKERRAQELHERCNGYLMSRKLEALAQQLVAMGFSHDRATMGLILNEGKVEESVAWLFEEGEEAVKHKKSTIGSGNLKIDISEELARIADMEVRYKCSKLEVERAIVAAEGDLDGAAEALSTLKLDPPTAKTEESGDPLSTNKVSMAATSQNLSVRPQPKPNPTLATQQRRDEKDFNYTKAAGTGGGSSESTSKNFQPLKRILPNIEWAKPQQNSVPADRRWPSSGSNPSASYSLTSPLQASPPPAKTESRYVAVGNDFKNFQSSIREPVVMMQRPQSINPNQVPATSISMSPPGTTSFMYPSSSFEIPKSNGFMPHIPSARSLSSNGLSSIQMHRQLYYPQQQQFTTGSGPGESPQTSRVNGLSSRTGASPVLAPASSLGLFTGLNSTTTSGSSSLVDWTSGSSMAQLDYTNVDWRLDRSSPSLAGIWPGPTPSMSTSHTYYPSTNGLSPKPAMRLPPSNGIGVSIAGFLDGGVAPTESLTVGSHEWTSPFKGKDLFSLPKQFVSSPSL